MPAVRIKAIAYSVRIPACLNTTISIFNNFSVPEFNELPWYAGSQVNVTHGEDSEGIVKDKGQRMLAPLF
jgi:hypothetical protein